ncbi:MAG TPA: ATP-binding protein [Actinomycetota bacterium]|nr:ATP-binding protein [Actinomycetota bacterium]
MSGVAQQSGDPIDVRPGLSAPERSRRTLIRGVLVFRWVWLAWMSIVAFTGGASFRSPGLAWTSIGVAGAWTAWLTVSSRRWDQATLWIDLAVCGGLIVVSALVVFEGDVIDRSFFATGYPLTAPLSWGVRRGPRGGLVAGAFLSALLIATRPLNGVALQDLPAREVRDLVSGIINYLVAGGAVGFVSILLVRSAEALQTATEELVRERERAARLAERESLAREIHDSVLQVLALIHKKGRELARRKDVPPDEVGTLAALAEAQEVELRSLILRDPERVPEGTTSLRAELEALARSVSEIEVSVGCVGPIWVERRIAGEVVAAVRQALANVVEHARASKATVFAEEDGERLLVSVRDDGVGFVYDEDALRADGKAGLLKSIKGRVEDLGGCMTVTSASGRGTEIELSVPARGRG